MSGFHCYAHVLTGSEHVAGEEHPCSDGREQTLQDAQVMMCPA